MIEWIVALALLALCIVFQRMRARPLKGVPGPTPKFFLGNFLEVAKTFKEGSRHLYFTNNSQRYGPVVAYSIVGGMSIVTVADPASILDALDKMVGLASPKEFRYVVKELFDGLIALQGPKWRAHRTPKSTNVEKTFRNMASAVLVKVAFGIEDGNYSDIEGRVDRFFAMFPTLNFYYRISRPFFWPYIVPKYKEMDNDRKIVQSTLANVLAKKRALIDQGGADESKTLLGMMIELGKQDVLTDQEILDEAMMFYFAGRDTTSNSLTFAVYELAQNPDMVERVYQEVMEVCGHEPITWEHVHQLNYVEMVVKETLRKWPVAPLFGRELEETTTIAGHEMPAGTIVMILVYAIHHDPAIWPDPETFDPERFREIPRPGTYYPFGSGERMCIGNRFAMLELKTALAHIVRRFTFTFDHTKPIVPQSDITLGVDPTIGMNVFLTERHH